MPIFDRLKLEKLGHWMMDAEHRQLVVLINEVEIAISSGKGEEEIRTQFEKLVVSAGRHFVHEDDAMIRSGYPEREHHIARHRDLEKSLANYAVADPAHRVDRRLRAVDAIQFFEEWLVAHAKDEDAKLAAWLNAKGVR